MSKSYDDRIVRMGFDNAKFESNAAKTMSTLDKLDTKLKLKGATEGSNNIQRSIDSINFASMERAIMNIERRFSTLGVVGMNVIGKITNGIMGSVKQLEAATIGQIKSGGWSRAMNIANAKFQIEGLGFAWEEVENAISYGVKDTAYGLDAAASAASQLAASGVDFKKTLKTVNGQGLTAMHKSLRAISGVAAMTNSSYEDIARIFTTVAGNGRLMGDQLLQLSSRGMNAAAKLAETLNTTEGEIRDMVSRGMIDFQTFAFAMDDAFGDHAKEANKTFTGALGNMKAALSRFGEVFSSPVINKTNTLFISLTARIDEFKNKLKSVEVPRTLEEIKKQYGDISANASAYDAILKSMGDRTVTFGDHFSEMWQSGIDAFSEMVKSVDISWFDTIVEKVDETTTKLKDFFDLIKDIYSESAEEAADGVNDATKTLLVSAKEAQAAKDILERGMYGNGQQRVDALTKLFGDGDAGKQHAKNVQAYIDSVISAQWNYEKATIKVAKANDELENSQEAISQQVKKSRIQTVINNITGSLGNLHTAGKNIATSIVKIGTAVLDGINFERILSNVKSLTDNIVKLSEKLIINDKSAQKITESVKSVIDKVKSFIDLIDKQRVTDIVDDITGSFSNLFDTIKNLGSKKSPMGDLQKQVKTERIRNAINDIIDGLHHLWNTAKNLATAAGKILVAVGKGIFKIDFGGAIGTASRFTEVLEKISEKLIISDKTSKLITKVFEVIIKVSRKAISVVQTVFEKLSSLFDMVKNSGFVKTVKSIFTNLSNSIKSAFDGKSLKQVITEAVNYVRQGISELLGLGKKQVGNPAAAQKNLGNAGQIVSGQNGIAGLFARLKQIKLPKIDFKKIAAFIKGLIDSIRSLNLKDVLNISYVSFQVSSIIKLCASLRNAATVADSVSNGIKKVMNVPETINKFITSMQKTATAAIKEKASASAKESNAKAVLALAGSIALLAGAIVVLTMVNPNRVITATITMATLMVALTAMFVIVGREGAKLNEEVGGIKKFIPLMGTLVVLIGTISSAMIKMSIATLIASKADPDSMFNILISAAVLLGGTILLLNKATSIEPKRVLAMSAGIMLIFNSLTKLVLAIGVATFLTRYVDNVEIILIDILGFVALITGILYLFMKRTDALDPTIVDSRALVLAGTITIIATAMYIIAGALKKVSGISNIEQLVVNLVGSVILIGLSLWLISDKLMTKKDADIKSKMLTFSAAVLIIALATSTIAKAMRKLKDVSNIESVALAMTGTLGTIAIMIGTFLSYTEKNRYDQSLFPRLSSFAGGVIMLAQSLVMITQAFKIAGDISNLETTAFTMLASLGVVELVLLSFIKATDKNKYDSSLPDRIGVMIKAFIAISASLLIISMSLKRLNGIDDIFSIGVVMVGMVGVIGIVIAAFAELTKKQVASTLAERIGAIGSAFMAIAAAVLMISIAMGIIGKIPDVAGAMLAVGGLILLISVALGAFVMMSSKSDRGSKDLIALAASFIVISVALSILANAIAKLSGMQSGLLAAAVGFGIFGAVIIGLSVAAAAFPAFAIGLDSVGRVFLFAGAGALLLGGGMYLLFTAFSKLSLCLPLLNRGLDEFFKIIEEHKEAAIAIGIVTSIVIVAMALSIAALMPTLSKIAGMIADVVKSITATLANGTSKAKSWLSGLSTRGKIAIVTLITTLCGALLKSSPTILDTLGKLILKVLEYLASIAGKIANALLDFLINVINGVADAIRANSARIAAALWGVVIALIDVVLQIFGQLLYMLVAPFHKGFAESIRDTVTSESAALNEFAIQQRKMAEDMDKAKMNYALDWHGAGGSIKSVADETEDAADRSKKSLGDLGDTVKTFVSGQKDDLGSLKEEYQGLPGYAYDAILRSKAAQKLGGESLLDGITGDVSIPNTDELLSENGLSIPSAGDYGSEYGTELTDETAIAIAGGSDEIYDATTENTGSAQQAIIDSEPDTKKAVQEHFNDPFQLQIRSGKANSEMAVEYVVGGMIKAMDDKNESYAAAAVRLAKAGNRAFEKENEINSPSKLYYQNGEYIVQGLVNGIEQNTQNVESAVGDMSNAILVSFGNPIDYLSKITTGELEYDPSIRPVFDGSSIRTGADSINSMLRNQTVSVSGFSGKLAADISSLDHTNSDVVGELRALREDMSYMQEAITNMQIVMDTGALVGSTVDAYDEAFGRRAVYGRRGN